MRAALLGDGLRSRKDLEPLRYMICNDHRPEVREFLAGDWLTILLGRRILDGAHINHFAYQLGGLADPGPLRERINAQIRAALDSENPILVANALHILAGAEGYPARFSVPGVADRVHELVESPVASVATRARRALERVDPQWVAMQVTYEEAFLDLYELLGREYPCFKLKGIDWQAVGKEFAPRAKEVTTDEEFALLCVELVARLEDSHAHLSKGTAELPDVAVPRWDPGLACLIDARGELVVYYVDQGGPAENRGGAGRHDGSHNQRETSSRGARSVHSAASLDTVAFRVIGTCAIQAARWFVRQVERGAQVTFTMRESGGETRTFELPANLGVRYLPRLPVPIPGVSDSADVSWTRLADDIGYIYVRRIRKDLIQSLDRAVAELQSARALIIDVRGNSGGGFDARRAHRNFALDDEEEPQRPRFKKPLALLIDARCISAGEGWASWFIANKRACVFGEATAGASARKRTYTLKNALYQVTFPVKAYRGYLDRPIERRGLEPDVPLRQTAEDLEAGRDTVLEAAREYLLKAR